MTKNPTSDDIEREIEAERVALARSLDNLQRELSPDALIDKATAILRANGGEMATAALRHAKDNPVALALTGAGLAWLVAGPAPTRPARAASHLKAPAPAHDDRAYPKAPGLRRAPPAESFEARVARAEGERYDPVVHDLSEPSKSTATEPASGGKSLRDRLMEGTEMMTDTARDRVIAAREAAIAAERRLEAHARDYGRSGRDAFQSQPLMGALVAFGVGALAGALLPRTRTEDHYLGATRDRAMDEAERIYRAEAAKLRAVAEAAAAEAGATATEAFEDLKGNTPTGQDAVDRVERRARSAGERVATAAKDEAAQRNLGGSIN